MISKLHRWMLASMMAAALGLDYTAAPSHAQQQNAIEKSVKDIAGEFKKGKEDAVRKLAVAAAKKVDDTSDLMYLFKAKKVGGMGIGATLGDLAKIPDAKIAEEVSYPSAAMAELILAKAPAKNAKLWNEQAEKLRAASLDLAKAAAKNDVKGIKTAAERANATCINSIPSSNDAVHNQRRLNPKIVPILKKRIALC